MQTHQKILFPPDFEPNAQAWLLGDIETEAVIAREALPQFS
jgi:hypothetical protein